MTTKLGIFKVVPFLETPGRAKVTLGVNRNTQVSPSGKYLPIWMAKIIGPKELSTWKS